MMRLQSYFVRSAKEQLLLAVFLPLSVFAQTTSSLDSTQQLTEVTVRGYESNRPLLETAASVGLLTSRELNQRFGTPTLVPAMNTLPGVRMDERSPGSYRLSIRGSLIRSPFGVRNVKVYWNELPLTDAGGNTPLNALDVRAVGRVEVLKGPSGSLYGANTGGTVLFSGLNVQAGKASVESTVLGGSYGILGYGLTAQTGKNNTAASISYNHIQGDGYRVNSAMARDNISLTSSFQVSEKRTVSIIGFYSDLYYQTPGGLNATQFKANPRQSRPATPTLPGSADQGAAIYQKLGYLGASHQFRWNQRWQNTTVLYGSLTDFTNPFISNYEKRADQGIGGRTVTRWQHGSERTSMMLTFGAEFQQNFTVDRNFGNKRGQPDTLQTDDELRARQSVLFIQEEVSLSSGLILTAGLSRNDMRYGFIRFSSRPAVPQRRNFDPVWLPRFAVLQKITNNVSAFASISTGYSAPTTQEVRPSEATFNTALRPERGTSYEVGVRGVTLQNKLRFDIAAYQFQLRETIVRRSAANGAEYFLNAGRTRQQGIETSLSYAVKLPFVALQLWNSLTMTNYRYLDYLQGSTDFSGKRVPGVAPITNVAGIDVASTVGLYMHASYQFLNPFVLDDANAIQASPTRIATATLGYRRTLGATNNISWVLDGYVSGDNLLNQTYSLGYDLNAFAGRYYNVAAGRAGFVGLRIKAVIN